ncbi:NAD-dependent succinate-semialdehyde dehydrogenase [Alteromonas sp. C1M14]|uniref:NAD-dependent succinate-semialdehyde dehydrogenase n=1 Tax=Alteromonas sp. C1M14 TaxID=2841567 RepID=UPI001C081BE4|nr:NAD-dependent succinate-semialdehyde dehydrogenase [Alteromonas sp. C1M14]MBU2979893.1 NAD-dependent succinate-semialdehyde dehydrogenase [Alteromonas sp. C1M14]
MSFSSNTQLLATSAFINGSWVTKPSTFAVTNPLNGEHIADVSDCDENDAASAIEAAKQAFPAWAAMPAIERSKLLKRWYALIIEHQDELGKILTLEQGKPLKEAVGEIGYGASFIEWFAEEARRLYGDTIPSASPNKRIVVIKQPVGVVTSITPWNFPNAMIARKAAAALAAGCTFVVRPATETPLSALALAVLAEQAGIPKGVLSIVPGSDAAGIGKVMTQHPDVAKFSFTGSTRVGKILTKQCADSVKRVSMELGGNAPFIVFEDADLDAAATGLIQSKYRNAGQTCVCTNRILVQESVYDKFLAIYADKVASLKMGDGLAQGTDIGPMIHENACKNVHGLVEDAIEKGATLVLGGTPAGDDNIYPPTVLGNVTSDMRVFREEIFGPVSPIVKFSDEQQAIAMANDTEYGLASYFYSKDIGRVWRVSEALDFGMVGINEGLISDTAAPFGGVKQSGTGREGSHYGLSDYTNIKYLCMGGIGQ